MCRAGPTTGLSRDVSRGTRHARIELDEGVRMVADLPGDDVDHVAIGQPVEVFFDDVPTADGGRFTLPRFRLHRDEPDPG
jgi:hypothetical protein